MTMSVSVEHASEMDRISIGEMEELMRKSDE